jgi:hypothetical protein
VRRGILHLVSHCPLIHLTRPDQRSRLLKAGFQPRNAAMLGLHPSAAPVRRFVAETLVDRIRDGGQWDELSPALWTMFSEQLSTGDTAEAWIVVEFTRYLCEAVFGSVHQSLHLSAKGEPEASGDAAKRFRTWMEGSHAKFLLNLLVALVRFRCNLSEAEKAREAADRFCFLWHDISRQATDGLFRRRWPSGLLMLLRQFWIRFCERIARELGHSVQALNTGNPDLDHTERMSCTLFRELARDHFLGAAEPRRSGETAAARGSGLETWIQGVRSNDGPLQQALWVHGLLEWKGQNEPYELNRRAILAIQP